MIRGDKAPSRVASKILGRDVPAPLVPILAVAFASTTASASLNLLLGIWALQNLEATPAALGVAFAASAVASPLTGVAAGWLADRISSRSALFLFLAAQAAAACFLAFSPKVTAVGLAAFVFWQMTLAGVATAETTVAAHVPVDCDDETRFGLLRVAQNTGWILGPLAAAAVVVAGWLLLFTFTAFFSAIACYLALKVPQEESGRAEKSGRKFWAAEMFRNPPFMVLLLGGLIGECVYVAFQSLLPISLVTFHGFSKSEVSLLLAINPVLILFLQVRVLKALEPLSLRAKLSGSMTALAGACVLMATSPTLGGALLVVVVFSLAEMAWVPAAQAAAAAVAPPGRLGLYLGVLGVTVSIAFGVAPWAGLAIQSSFGDAQMWSGFVAIAILAGAIYAFLAVSERDPVPSAEELK